MPLELIRIVNLRNISEGLLEPAPGINFIEGPNGSGKTSLLEAIYILGRGRSFRGNFVRSVIQQDKAALELYGIAVNKGNRLRIGVRKTGIGTEVRINGDRVKKLSILAREFPVNLITPGSHEIVEGSAENRRRFVDWGVFHVEPRYQLFSNRYQRALAQRNTSLKRDKESVEHWNFELAESGEIVNRMRLEYLEIVESYFQDECKVLLPDETIGLSWKQGWSENHKLIQALKRSEERDRQRGFTTIGPHRADLVISANARQASQRLSRGQQKLVVAALILAQSRIRKSKIGLGSIVLVDDLASELDQSNRDRVMGRLIEQQLQLFVTTTEMQFFRNYPAGKLFHVEHGAVSEERV